MRLFLLMAIAMFLLAQEALGSDATIGSVKTYNPEAIILHDDARRPAAVGARVYAGDTIVTRGEGTVGITFIDGSVLSLGPDSEFIIDAFSFRPAEKDVSFLSRMQRGTASFVSGAIGRISPESVKFKTPNATLGLRGTKILIRVR